MACNRRRAPSSRVWVHHHRAHPERDEQAECLAAEEVRCTARATSLFPTQSTFEKLGLHLPPGSDMSLRPHIAALIVFLALLGASPTRAGTYNVQACADAVTGTNNSWSASNNAPTKLEAAETCDVSGAYAG